MSPPTPTGDAPAQVFLRPIGNPLPLGFVGLAVATAVLSSFNLGWIPSSQQHQAAGFGDRNRRFASIRVTRRGFCHQKDDGNIMKCT